jgi:hypothetical protein
MIFFRLLAVVGVVFVSTSWTQGGVRFDFQGGERSGSGRPFNFGVSTTSPGPTGVWTAKDFSGENLGLGDRRLGLRETLQVQRHEGGTFDTFRTSTQSSNRRSNKATTGGGINAAGSLPDFGSVEQTNGAQPVSAGYCYCPGDPGDGDGDDDDDDDDGQTGDDDDDDDGGGGPDPSVVPEPGSFALWALAGALLIGVTRRQTNES